MLILMTLPVNLGGVAIDDREGLPQGKASITDKFMGKVEKVSVTSIFFTCARH